jgi:hypothetical protein
MKVTTEPPETDNPAFVTQEDLDRLIKELDTGERLKWLVQKAIVVARVRTQVAHEKMPVALLARAMPH